LTDVPVLDLTLSLLRLEFGLLSRSSSDYWQAILHRNDWFQDQAARRLQLGRAQSNVGRIFAYSYAAGRIFEAAAASGLRTVLGQIDPGPEEERIVASLHKRHTHLDSGWRPAPAEYWHRWREECERAEVVVVNSQWSRSALVSSGVPAPKITVVPLAYRVPGDRPREPRLYPESFTHDRPLRVLFLGSVILRKGIAEILSASRELANEPIEFWIVGPLGIVPPRIDRENSKIRWVGPVSRSEAHRYYREADVFLFPTHSDGFGLTQLEARSWALPIVASRFCGDVVEDGSTGRLLEEVSTQSVAEILVWCLRHPARLEEMSAAARKLDARFTHQDVISRLVAAAERPGVRACSD
jgi:glycosyltransferase involved in cell wall biosynthesis